MAVTRAKIRAQTLKVGIGFMSNYIVELHFVVYKCESLDRYGLNELVAPLTLQTILLLSKQSYLTRK